MKRRNNRGHRSSNKLVGLAVVVIVVALVFVINAGSREIKAKNDRDSIKIEQLKNDIEQEKKRSEQLEEYAKYINTKQFVEEIARDKLGLVYPDEKVFKTE